MRTALTPGYRISVKVVGFQSLVFGLVNYGFPSRRREAPELGSEFCGAERGG
jgi:hypothetical protein